MVIIYWFICVCFFICHYCFFPFFFLLFTPSFQLAGEAQWLISLYMITLLQEQASGEWWTIGQLAVLSLRDQKVTKLIARNMQCNQPVAVLLPKASFAWLEVLLMRTRTQTYSALAIWYHPTYKTTAKIYPVQSVFVLSICKSRNETKSILDLEKSVDIAHSEFLQMAMSCLDKHETDIESDTEVVL